MRTRGSAAYWGITLIFAIIGGMAISSQSILQGVPQPDTGQVIANLITMVLFAIPAFLFASAVTRRHLFRPNLILSAILHFETVVLAICVLFTAYAVAVGESLSSAVLWLIPLAVIGIAHVKVYLFLPVSIAFVWALRSADRSSTSRHAQPPSSQVH